MREWRLVWRADKRTFERLCPHGVDHPDPDALEYLERTQGLSARIHGCDGCCGMLDSTQRRPGHAPP
jgi:hypothetical protein